jgi:hypothetical protein
VNSYETFPDAPQDDWIPLSQGVKRASIYLGPERGGQELLKALQLGVIRAHGQRVDTPTEHGYRNIHIATDDFMRWLSTFLVVQQRSS